MYSAITDVNTIVKIDKAISSIKALNNFIHLIIVIILDGTKGDSKIDWRNSGNLGNEVNDWGE